MADKKDASKRKKSRKGKRVDRTERRFIPERSNAAMLTLAGTIAGGVAIGAGGYGQWVSDPRVAASPWLVAGGAVVLAAVILWGDMEGTGVRVGDAGVALEKQGKPTTRIAWCDMREVVVDNGTVRFVADEGLSFKVSANPLAAAWVVREAEERIPKCLKVEKAEREALPKTAEGDGERLEVEPLQVAGRACRASDRAITFERDARFCPRCGEVYHKDSLPEACLTCDADLSDA